MAPLWFLKRLSPKQNETTMPATSAIVVNNQAAAADNTKIIESAFLNSGSIDLPVGTTYINRTILTSRRVGCGRINTNGSVGYQLNGHPTMTGGMCRLVLLNPTPMPVLRLRGVGFFSNDPLEIVGNGGVGVEVEGHANPPVGRHRFSNTCFTGCSYAFDALGGYYGDDGKYQADENHADNTIVEGCETFSCQGLFRSNNIQAVNWVFRDCMVNGQGPAKPFTVCNIKRGGCVTLERLVIEESQCTLFEVDYYSPNNCVLVCRDFFFDRMAGPDGKVDPNSYLQVMKYSGKPECSNYSKWIVKVDGFAAQYLNPAKLYNIPADIPKNFWNVDIRNIYTS